MTACPCCRQTGKVAQLDLPEPHYSCPSCGHRWRIGNGDADYANKSGRNLVPARQLDRKSQDRLASVKPLLAERRHILEIGCAEGDFGALVKSLANVEYVGLEISRDARIAEQRLDKVLTQPAAELAADTFDLLLSFHVLEHIADIASEIGRWAGLLAPSGTMLIEVPNGAGHSLRNWDSHPEHLHFFTPASLSALLEHAGLAVEALSSGHYESPIYADSLRITARRATTAQEKDDMLLGRFRQQLGGPFVVYGIGGDFRNCILPLLDRLPVTALVDSDAARTGELITDKHSIQPYDPVKLAGLPILVSSVRFKQEICERLSAATPAPAKLVGLDDIYEMD